VIVGADIVGVVATLTADPKSCAPRKSCDPVWTGEPAPGTAAAAAVPTMATTIAMVVPSATIPAGSR
jgi:hypothetical protein